MFDLKSGVHFQKVKPALRIHEEFDSPGIVVVRRFCNLQRGLAHATPKIRIHNWRRTFLDHLLMPALNRAFAFAAINGVSVPIRNDLDFDVPWSLHEFLDVDRIVAKRG